MKKLITLILLLPMVCLSQLRDSIYIKTDVFEIVYSEVLEQPITVNYKVRPNVDRNIDRKGMYFYTNDTIHTSDDEDYYKNPWDKGHMAPASSFYDTYDNLKATFSYLNCSLQYYKLNRGPWRMLEQQEKKWANELGELSVEIKLDFNQSQALDTRAHIPNGYWKKIKFNNGYTQCFYFSNEEPKSKKFIDYKVKCDY